ncbi:MAG: hypothetical protein E7645_03795 [Ruminococcaceae bacterium]|nr:hypothetical protein [Oscillospiraceae bacterium]
MKISKKVLTIVSLAFFIFSLLTLTSCSADSLSKTAETNDTVTETNGNVDNKIVDVADIHSQCVPSQIKVGDTYQSFAHLDVVSFNLHDGFWMEKDLETGEFLFQFFDWGYLSHLNGTPPNVDNSYKLTEEEANKLGLILAQVEAPEGTYIIQLEIPYEAADKKDYTVANIQLISRPNRRYTTGTVDFPLSEVVVGDSFEKLLLFNPIPVKAEAYEINRIQYKMFVDEGEYIYTLERETQTAEFYITNIEFVEAI